MSKYGLDKFYTKKDIAKKCIDLVPNLNSFNFIIEPSAGNGSFSTQLENCISMDIQPENDEIIKQDFFSYNPEKLNDPILTIGNPPFGRNGSLAISFIKKASEFSDVIAFILPRSFKKSSFYDKVPLNFWKVKEVDLPDNSFIFEGSDVSIPCVFQIYEKRNEVRQKDQRPTKSKNFEFVSKEEANLSIRRVGIYAGKCFIDTEKSQQSHYFLRVRNPEKFLKLVNDIKWKHNNTVGPRSISKRELVEEIDKKIEKDYN